MERLSQEPIASHRSAQWAVSLPAICNLQCFGSAHPSPSSQSGREKRSSLSEPKRQHWNHTITRTLLVVALCSLVGCHGMNKWLPWREAPVCQVAASWQNHIVTVPDPAHGGRPVPAFVGRLYLFGPQIDFPRAGEGKVVVELYDWSDTSKEKPTVVECWTFDEETLKKLYRRDAIGWGYTLILPSARYHPNMTRVELKARFEPTNGSPLYAESQRMTLSSPANALQITQKSVVKPGFQQASKSRHTSATESERQQREITSSESQRPGH